MNKIKLSFRSQQKQSQFFIDQLPMLIFFYERVCIFGSISAVIIFCLEFTYPIGFGNSKYLIICLPLIFFISFKVINKYPKLFNYILPLNNLLIGLLYNINLLFNFIPDLNLMIGQTVVLVQFSLLLGSNFVLNMTIIIFNFSTLILVQTIVQKSFNGNQVMFILALILSCLSYYSNEYQKREFFLLKQRDDVQYGSLIEQFSIQLMKVKYDRRTNFLKLETQNHPSSGFYFSTQEEFRQFIRQIQIFKQQRHSMIQSKVSSSRIKHDFMQQNSQIRYTRLSIPNLESTETLEQLLYKSFTTQKTENFDFIQGYDTIGKCDYKIKILYIIEKGEAKAIVLLQQNEVKRQLIKVKQQRDYLKRVIQQFQSLFEIRIKQLSSLINPKKCLSHLLLQSEISFRLIQFISEYFSICLNKNDFPKLKISTINIQNLLQQIENPIRDYLDLKQIKFTYQTDQNLIIINDAYLITHLILSLLCFLIHKSPIQIHLYINQSHLSKTQIANVDEIIITISAQFKGTPKRVFEIDCFNQMIKKVIKIIGPSEQLINEYDTNQFGQEIKYECVIFKNIKSFKDIFSKL
ncbi:unnamed protein product [Paramecium pentaurelia]|uniref:Transmembrane protein n=1 Tax=Paramecium pentaurelia TaxID=43138 RepID=A0A8S1UUM4_9CILI|nr:unnamed protein product [Paramecium pentaurelia]